MEDVYKKMKKFEVPSKPKVNLGEFAERLKNLMKTRVFTSSPDIETVGSEVPAPEFDFSLLAFPDEVPAFNTTKPRDINSRPSAKLLMDASAELKSVQLFTKEIEKKRNAEKDKMAANAGRKTTEKEKTTIKSKKESEASGTKTVGQIGGLKQITKDRGRMKSHQLQPKPAYDPEKSDLVSGEEFAVKCQVFQPFHYKRNIHKSGRRPVFQSEIEILGSNTLLHLRNMIFCSEDFISTDGDVSDNPNAEPSPSTLKDLYPSSMFFINETFYVDFSQPCDYSAVVKEWAQFRNIKVNPDTKDMAATRISDLTVEMNYPYLFQHLGNCEHLIQFSEGRLLIAKRDSLCSADYPWLRKNYITKGQMCIICTISYPTRKVVGYARLPSHNALLCEDCFKSYCYIGDEKVGSFEAFHYKDKRITISS